MTKLIIGILGVLTGMAIFVIIAWFYVKNKIKAMAHDLTNALGGMQAIPPFKITLHEEFEPKFNHQQNFTHCQRLLLASDFQSAGTFFTDQVEGLIIEGFVHADGYLAALYDHPQAGVFVDIVTKTENNHWFVISSNSPQGMESPENCTKSYLHIPPDEDDLVTKLLDKLKEDTNGKSLCQWQIENFRSIFEKAYNSEMQWRIQKGGVTDEEILSVAELTGQEPPDEEILELVKDNWKMAIIGHVDDEVRDACLETISMPLEEWEKKRERLFIIHSYSDPDNIACDVTYSLIEDQEENDNYEEIFEAKVAELKSKLNQQSNLAEAFERINQELPSEKKYEPLCKLEAPYEATVFISPKMSHDYC
ncbi:MAG: hypothetical protein MK132_09355 [Lentisphaerales bacterium]|nr:hypothetical protein [Lentisphaerales bacterium]